MWHIIPAWVVSVPHINIINAIGNEPQGGHGIQDRQTDRWRQTDRQSETNIPSLPPQNFIVLWIRHGTITSELVHISYVLTFKWECIRLKNFSSPAALEVVKKTNSSATSDENFVNMVTFQWVWRCKGIIIAKTYCKALVWTCHL